MPTTVSKGMSKGLKVGLIIAGAALVAVILYMVFKPAAKNATGQQETPPPAALNMPPLSVLHDATNQTDNYAVNFGVAKYYYTKGDAPVNVTYDSTWSLRFETSQDLLNQFQVTVFQNGNTVFSQLYV